MERKDQYVQKLHATIDEWSAKLDRAEAKVKSAEASAKARYEQALATLKRRVTDLKSRTKELEQARADTWDAVKRSVEIGVEEFKREYTSAREKRNLTELEALPAAGETTASERP